MFGTLKAYHEIFTNFKLKSYFSLVNLEERFIKRRNNLDPQFVPRVSDVLDNTGVTGPLDILIPDGHQVVSLPHTSDLKYKRDERLSSCPA